MIRKWFTLACLLITSLIVSNEVSYEQIVFGGEPSAIIDGCVHAITGDYFINEDDWVVNGHEPIPIRRRYLSSQAEEEKFGGWEFFFHHLVATRICTSIETELYAQGGDTEKLQNYYYDLYLPEKFGFSLTYETQILECHHNSNISHSYKLKEPYPKSLTNCFSGEIGGRLNAFNNHVYTDPNNRRVILVEAADGIKRAYENLGYDYIEGKSHYHLKWETLPNTNMIHYQWHQVLGKQRLKTITTTDATTQKHYACVNIEYQSSNEQHLNAIKFITSDNHEIVYHIRNLNHGRKSFWLIDRIEHSGKPNESYGYWGPEKTDGCPLVDRIFQSGRKKHIDYYDIGYANIKNEHDKKFKRVKALSLPIHPHATSEDPKLVSVLNLSYEPGIYERSAGATSISDCYGNFTHYYYDKDFLLQKVKYDLSNGELALEEHFEWTPYEKTKGHWIKSKKIFGDGHQLLRTTTYHYDTKGNVIGEQLTGNLQGLYPNSNYFESVTISRSYNDRNLIVEEKFPNGKRVEYAYVPGTALIAKKLIFDNSELKIRHFYFYDGSFLKREITDDGISYDPYDLSNVNTRLIREYTPKTDGCYLDFPIEIQEKYYDAKLGQERLLSKQTILAYNKHGHLEDIAYYDASDMERYTSHLSYGQQGRLISKSDPKGRKEQYDYDANDNVILHQNPQDPHPTKYGYDLANRLIEEKLDERRTAYDYNYLHQVIKETDFRGNASYYEPNRFGHVLKTTLPPIETDEHQVKTPEIHKVYNSLGKVHIETDPEGNQTETYYTTRGDPYRVIHPDGCEELFTYDLSGNLKTQTSPEGTRIEYDYDFLDRMINKKVFSKEGMPLSQETWAYNAFNLIEYTTPDDIKTYYGYDGAGRKVSEITENRETCYEYDEFGRLYRTIHPIDESHSRIIEETYDLLDRLEIERELDQNGKEYSITKYTYDDFDNRRACSKEVQLGESIEKTDYDAFGRVTRKVDPLGNTSTIDYDDYYKNAYGQTVLKKTNTNPNGTQTIEIFDTHDNLSLLEKISPSGELLLREEFFYNLNDQKINQRSTLFSPHRTITKTWKYDNRGRLAEMCEAVSESIERVTTYSYDPDDNLTQIIKPSGLRVTYTYDGLGRKTSVHTSDNSCHYELVYDQMDNIIEAKNLLTGKSTKRTYNHFGNLLVEKLENGLATAKEYDELGRKTKLTLPDGSSILYLYDLYHLRAVQRLSTHNVLLYSHNYDDYDQSHNLLSESLINNLGKINHTVDLLSRRTKSTSLYTKEEIYAFDPNGNMKHLLRGDKSFNFDYDPLDQLILEEGNFNHTYLFDAHYDRLTKDNISHITNSHHELEDHSYTYQSDGNLIASPETAYTYDGFDRLIEINTPSTHYHFHYDYFNRLLTQETSTYSYLFGWQTTPEHYLFDDRNELGSFPNELRILGQGLGAEIGAAIAIEKQNNLYAPLHDLFGSITSLINTSGQIVESYAYSAFGEEKIYNSYGFEKSTSPLANPWRYKSKRKINSYVHFGRRFYDPSLGRFLSPDPKGFDEGPNLYQYALNNPFSNIDLYGEEIDMFEFSRNFWDSGIGIAHAGLDFIANTSTFIMDLGVMGLTSIMKDGDQVRNDYFQARDELMQSYEDILQNYLGGSDNPYYYDSRIGAQKGIEIGATVTSIYAMGKSAIAYGTRSVLNPRVLSVLEASSFDTVETLGLNSVEGTLKVGKFTYSNTAAKHFAEFVKKGPNAGRLSRPYMKSQLTIEKIMTAGKPIPDQGGIPGGLRWDVPGAFRGSEGTWELVIHPETNVIYHFNFK